MSKSIPSIAAPIIRVDYISYKYIRHLPNELTSYKCLFLKKNKMSEWMDLVIEWTDLVSKAII